MREAAHVLPVFWEKTISAHHFTKSMWLTHCATTHMVQKHDKETQIESKDFIAMMKGRLSGRNKDDIIKMDQTSFAYYFNARTMLEAKGTKIFQVRQPTQNVSLLQVRLGSTQNVSLLQRLSLPVARCCPLYELQGSKQRAHCHA